jgi:hypothetical protein
MTVPHTSTYSNKHKRQNINKFISLYIQLFYYGKHLKFKNSGAAYKRKDGTTLLQPHSIFNVGNRETVSQFGNFSEVTTRSSYEKTMGPANNWESLDHIKKHDYTI